jgi:hypothetical protein
MPAPLLSAAERRQRLALVCQLDRLHLRLALRPAPSAMGPLGGLAAPALTPALAFAQLLPGPLGRLARGFALGSALFRTVQPWLRSSRSPSSSSP